MSQDKKRLPIDRGQIKAAGNEPLTSEVIATKTDAPAPVKKENPEPLVSAPPAELKTRFLILEVCAVITAASALTIAVTLIAIYLK